MSAFEVLFAEGTAVFFACVGIGAAVASWASGFSFTVSLCLATSSIVFTALLWLVFAPYPRDIWQMPRLVFTLVVALLRTAIAYVLRGCQPRFPQWTFEFELLRASERALSSGIFTQYIGRSQQSQYHCKQFELLGKRLGPQSCTEHGTSMELVTLNGLEHVWIRDPNRKPDQERFVIIYYHGGGYIQFAPHYFVDLMNRVRSTMLAKIKQSHLRLANVSVECLLANYRKSPDFKYPVPQEDALLMFEYVVAQEKVDASHIAIMGDSAGGALCLSTMLRLKAKQANMPAAALLSCPFTDFAVGEEADDSDDSNCMMPLVVCDQLVKAHHPTPQDKATWHDACAVYCDLSGLPPALIQVGSVDSIYKTSVKLHDKAKADGLTTWELDVFPNMPHAFTCLPASSLPDAARGIDHIATFAVRHFDRARKVHE